MDIQNAAHRAQSVVEAKKLASQQNGHDPKCGDHHSRPILFLIKLYLCDKNINGVDFVLHYIG